MMSEEMKNQQIEMLIRFYNMQAGARFRVGEQQQRICDEFAQVFQRGYEKAARKGTRRKRNVLHEDTFDGLRKNLFAAQNLFDRGLQINARKRTRVIEIASVRL